ncbi:MAG: protein kinase [Gemmatimonadetes bacterium]|nr:protein kinase [Gemmatimonadota bacterium]
MRLLREFSHPNILPVLDSGEWKGRPFYVMRYVEGESLQERLRRERRLPFDEVVRIGRRLCDALAYAHERKVVHRDVKPANVMVAGDAVYLTDFGIAKALERPVHSTTRRQRGVHESRAGDGRPGSGSPERRLQLGVRAV